MAVRAVVGLGSNMGDRRAHLDRAVDELAALGRVVARSAWYETAPVGGPEQGPFLNGVVIMDTDLGPRDLLDALLAVERREGRERRVRWGPRTLDLDLLLYGEEVVAEPGLQVPHPGLTERRFVLVPLLEVWPAARLPDGTPLASFLPGVAHQHVAPADGAPHEAMAPWAPLVLFLIVGLGAVAVWWLMDLFLR